jgi:chemotaxis protein MotD
MPANAQAHDANRADQDSPFALLMAASAPKEDKSAREQNEVEKPANDQPAAQPVRPQSRTESKPAAKAKPNEKAKPDTTAENDNPDKKEEAAVHTDNVAPQADVQTAQANPPPQTIVPPIVMPETAIPAVAPSTVAQEISAAATDTAAALPQPATEPAQNLAALTAAGTPKDAVPQTAPDAVPAVGESAPQPQTPQAAAPQLSAAQIPVPETQTPQDAASQTTAPQGPQAAVPQATPPQTNAAENGKALGAKEIVVQIAALQNPAKPAETDQSTNIPATADASIKTDTAKPVVAPGQAENKDGKPDAPRPEMRPEMRSELKPEMAKADSAQPDIAQPAPVEATKSTPPALSTNMAPSNATTQPQQAAAPAATPGVPQHVEVSTGKPNMPALAVEIAAKSQSGAKQFDIRLDPPELGRVEIRLSIDAAGKASAHLSADQPQTLDLLQKDAASLTRALREAGLNVSQDGLNFSLRQQSHDGNGAQQGHARHASRSLTLIATNSIEATQTSAAYRGDGRLDIRV